MGAILLVHGVGGGGGVDINIDLPLPGMEGEGFLSLKWTAR